MIYGPLFALCLAIYQVAWVLYHYPHATKAQRKAAFNLVPKNPIMEWRS